MSSAPLVLAIDTAGSACSVAVGRGGDTIATERQVMRHGHGQALLPMIDRVVNRAGLSPTAIDVVAVSTGPGGFTGIRVGLAAAQGIALAARAELRGVTSFAAVAAVLADQGADSPLLIALESRRAEIYVQLFSSVCNVLSEPAAVLPEALNDHLRARIEAAPVFIAGDMAETAAQALKDFREFRLRLNSAPDACGVLAAIECYRCGVAAGTVTAESLRPLYLRPADVTLPKPVRQS